MTDAVWRKDPKGTTTLRVTRPNRASNRRIIAS